MSEEARARNQERLRAAMQARERNAAAGTRLGKAAANVRRSFGEAPTTEAIDTSVRDVDTGSFQLGGREQMLQAARQGAFQAGGRQAPEFGRESAAQQEALGLALASARGQGPSAAEMQLQQGQEAAIRAAMAQAASARGVNPALAARQAQAQQAGIMGQANQQAASLRAQEQLAGQQLAGQLAGQARGQELQLGQQQLQQQAQNDALVRFFSEQGLNIEQAQLAANIEQQRLQQAQSLAELEARQRQQEFLTGAALQGRAQDIEAALGQRSIAAQRDAARRQERAGIIGGIVGGVGSAAGGIGSAIAMSDRRAKTGVKKGDKDIREFMKALSAKTWNYKAPERHGKGRHVGVMAQDVAKSKIGKEVIVDHDGLMALDIRKALGAALAGMANLNSRLEKAGA